MIKNQEAYNRVQQLRRDGLGRRRIFARLQKENYNIPIGTVGSWLYYGRRPRLKGIPESSKALTPEKSFVLGVVGPGDGFTSRASIGLAVIDKDFAFKFKACIEKIYQLACSYYFLPPSG